MLHKAIQKVLLDLFDNFQSDFRALGFEYNHQVRDIEQNNDILQFSIAALYQLHPSWKKYVSVYKSEDKSDFTKIHHLTLWPLFPF